MSMIRFALTATVVALLVAPPAAMAGTGGVAAPVPGSHAGGGATAGDPTLVHSPKPPKPRKRKRRRPAVPAPTAPHVFPLAGPFSWPGTGGRFGAGRPGHIHQGFDLLAAEGVPVVAPHAGVVTTVDYQAGGAGYYVVLRGSDYDYAFMHLAAGSTRVRVGQALAKGARIGDVGATGDAQGSHLHFEVWKGPWQQGGQPIDPEPLLRRWPAPQP